MLFYYERSGFNRRFNKEQLICPSFLASFPSGFDERINSGSNQHGGNAQRTNETPTLWVYFPCFTDESF